MSGRAPFAGAPTASRRIAQRRVNRTGSSGSGSRRSRAAVCSCTAAARVRPRRARQGAVGAVRRYQLMERLGLGGMTEVFRARVMGPEGFEREIALKRIRPPFCQDAEFVRMFVAEARLAATLHHANIVQILDFDVV